MVIRKIGGGGNISIHRGTRDGLTTQIIAVEDIMRIGFLWLGKELFWIKGKPP